MTFDQISTFFIVLLAIAGGIATLTSAIAGIIKIRDIVNQGKVKKDNAIQETLSKHTEEIKTLKDDIEPMKKDISESKEMMVLLCKGVKSLMDSSISGNGIDALKKTRKELDDYLINRDLNRK